MHSLPLLLTLLLTSMAWGQRATPGNPAEARSRWVGQAAELRTPRYILRTDLPVESRPVVLRHIDGYYDAVGDIFKGIGIEIQGRNEIWIFNNDQAYRACFPQLSGNVAGHFSPDSGIAHTYLPSSFLDGTDPMGFNRTLSTLLHEVTHQILYRGFRNVTPSTMDDRLPRWCNEGLASFIQRGVPTADGLFVGPVTTNDWARVQAMAQAERLLPLSKVTAITTAEWFAHTSSHDLYLQGWLAIHFMIYADGGRYRQVLGNLLQSAAGGLTWDRAVTEVLGRDGFSRLDASYRNFVLSLKPNDLSEAIQKAVFLADGIRRIKQESGRNVAGQQPEAIRRRLAELEHHYTFGPDFGNQTMDAKDPTCASLPRTGGVFKSSMSGGGRSAQPGNDGLDVMVWTEGLVPRDIRVSWNRKDGRWQVE